MNKLKSGYYSYSAKHGISYLGKSVLIHDYPKDTALVEPTGFHQLISMCTFSEIIITYFKADNDLLTDLSYTHTIIGL